MLKMKFTLLNTFLTVSLFTSLSQVTPVKAETSELPAPEAQTIEKPRAAHYPHGRAPKPRKVSPQEVRMNTKAVRKMKEQRRQKRMERFEEHQRIKVDPALGTQ